MSRVSEKEKDKAGGIASSGLFQVVAPQLGLEPAGLGKRSSFSYVKLKDIDFVSGSLRRRQCSPYAKRSAGECGQRYFGGLSLSGPRIVSAGCRVLSQGSVKYGSIEWL